MISADPRVKPTTAIKALGITDPSAIRRLRDKFNVAHRKPAAVPDLSSSNNRSGLATPSSQAANDAAPPLRALPALTVVARTTASADSMPALEAGHGLAALLPIKDRLDSVPMAALMFGFGLNAATALFEQQMTLATNLLKVPQVRDLVRSQIALTEFMLSVTHPSPGSRLTH